jgi:hypothetical protein
MVRLTDIAIRNLKAGTARREIPDSGQRGLAARDTGQWPAWPLRHRAANRRQGVRRPLQVRRQAQEAHPAGRHRLGSGAQGSSRRVYQLEQGSDPSAVKQRARDEQRAAAADTLEAVCAEFFKRDGAKIRSAYAWQRDLARLVFPTLGRRPIADIRRKDVVRLLDDIEDNNGAASADVTLAIIRRIMNWFAVRDDNFRSPIVRGMRRHKSSEHARSRILTDDELRAV